MRRSECDLQTRKTRDPDTRGQGRKEMQLNRAIGSFSSSAAAKTQAQSLELRTEQRGHIPIRPLRGWKCLLRRVEYEFKYLGTRKG